MMGLCQKRSTRASKAATSGFGRLSVQQCRPGVTSSRLDLVQRALTLLAALLLSQCVATTLAAGLQRQRGAVQGNVSSGIDRCEDFKGFFRAYGRFRPDHGYGDPLPHLSPVRGGNRNEAFLSRVMGCYPNCSLGMNSLHSAFAVRYRGGVLEWAALHAPSGDVVYHGSRAVACENGVLAHSSKFEIRLRDNVTLFPLPRGSSEDIRYFVINTDGALVSYDASSFRGTVLLVIPIDGTKRGDEWFEFPPAAVDVDIDALFDGLAPPQGGEVVTVGDPRANPAAREWARRQPDVFTVRNHGADGLPWTRAGDVEFRLWEVGVEKGADGYYTTFARLDARRGRDWLNDFRLERSHRPGGEPEFRTVFGEEVALRSVTIPTGITSTNNPRWAHLLHKRADDP